MYDTEEPRKNKYNVHQMNLKNTLHMHKWFIYIAVKCVFLKGYGWSGNKTVIHFEKDNG